MKYALKIHKDTRDYWVEMRQRFTNNFSLQNGVLLLWSPWAQSAGGSELLDATPGSVGGKNDAALQIGRTFDDTDAKVQITPIAFGNTSPQSIDVRVTFTSTPTNPPPVVSIVAVDASASETGPDAGSVTVSRTGSTAGALTVRYSVSGTASAASDYLALSGTVTLPAGLASATIAVSPINDSASEGNETVMVTLTADPAYTVSSTASNAIVTIADNDLPTISIGDVTVAEGNSGSANATFAISLSTPATVTVTVNYTTANGTATAGSDYVAATGSITFAAGSTGGALAVAVIGDTALESNETFFVNLSGAINATISRGQATCTINNDDLPPASTSLRLAPTADNRAFALTITGQPGAQLAIEASADLKSWSQIATVTNVTGVVQYLDSRIPTLTRRFYRIRS